MKKVILSLLFLLTVKVVWAQVPQQISYQSVIRDGNNVVVASSPVGIKISLLKGSATGPAVYVETHRKTTNANGLVSLEIGTGTVLSGSFVSIDWANGPYLIQTETDPTGGTNYSIPAVIALNSVPYALFAANGTPGPKGDIGAKGDKGDTGATGPAGSQGPIGLTGPAGSQGLQGPTGASGAAGVDGKTVLNGTTNPTNQGANGDFYINTATNTLFGPKAGGTWPSGFSLVGPQGQIGLTGPAGSQGIQGPSGATGATGAAGVDGKTVLNGTTNPTNQGVDGDFYINTNSNTLFGPKASGTWPSGVSLIGPQGVTGSSGAAGQQGPIGLTGPAGSQGIQGPSGATGATGAAGVDGKTVLNGTTNPTNQGVDGDFYINTNSNTLFGPKASGTWPSGFSLVGPQGATGAAGAQGVQGPTGATGAAGPAPAGTGIVTVISGSLQTPGALTGDVTTSGGGLATTIGAGKVTNNMLAGSIDLTSKVTGTLPVANGGTGVATLTGYIKGTGTTAMTASASIPVADVTGAAPLASPTFTGTPAAPTATAGTNSTQLATTEFVTSAVSTANATNANLTGVVTSVGNATAIADGVLAIAKTDGLQTALDLKAPLASPTFTGTVSGITSAMVGLGNVNNTSDANKPVSTATQTALDLKSPLASPTFTGTPAAPTATAGDNTTQVATTAFVTSAVSTANATNANLTGPVTSVGNATAITTGAITNAMLANGAVANLSGTNTGDQTTISGNAGTVTNGVYTVGDQTIAGVKTFSSTIVGSISGNAATVTTNANLTGPVTSVGNATAIADGVLAIAKTNGLQTALDSKAPLASPTFTGTVSGITSAMVGLGNVNNTSDANKPVSTATQTALDLKSPLASPTFTGTPLAPTATAGTNTTQLATTEFVTSAVSTANATNANLTGVVTSVGNATAIADGVLAIAKTDGLQTALDSKAPLASPTFTGTVSGITSAMVGLGNVNNTSDANKPVSTATQTALDLKSPLASPTFTGTPLAPTATAGTNSTQLATTAFVTSAVSTANATNANLTGVVTSVGNATAIADGALAIAKTSGLQTALDLKAPLASPTFTGTVSGITSAMVGLGNVNNTSDANKPVSTATQTALDLKSP
uniref:hypothetical protein n=1 Tax=Algoriphagus sp. TaxID=1872435 RepID=UPI0040476401